MAARQGITYDQRMRTLLGLLVAAVAVLDVTPASGSCAYVEPVAAKLVVDSCAPVDTANVKNLPGKGGSYAGILLEGTVTAGKDKPTATKIWVPAAEKLACAAVKAAAEVSGTLSRACCDGDPNPPCYLGTSWIFTKVVVKKSS